jgi:hypothetical protein
LGVLRRGEGSAALGSWAGAILLSLALGACTNAIRVAAEPEEKAFPLTVSSEALDPLHPAIIDSFEVRYPLAEVLRVGTTQEDTSWKLYTDPDTGTISSRCAEVWVGYRESGSCRFAKVLCKQQNLGQDQWGPLVLDGVIHGGDGRLDYPVDCTVLKGSEDHPFSLARTAE